MTNTVMTVANRDDGSDTELAMALRRNLQSCALRLRKEVSKLSAGQASEMQEEAVAALRRIANVCRLLGARRAVLHCAALEDLLDRHAGEFSGPSSAELSQDGRRVLLHAFLQLEDFCLEFTLPVQDEEFDLESLTLLRQAGSCRPSPEPAVPTARQWRSALLAVLPPLRERVRCLQRYLNNVWPGDICRADVRSGDDHSPPALATAEFTGRDVEPGTVERPDAAFAEEIQELSAVLDLLGLPGMDHAAVDAAPSRQRLAVALVRLEATLEELPWRGLRGQAPGGPAPQSASIPGIDLLRLPLLGLLQTLCDRLACTSVLTDKDLQSPAETADTSDDDSPGQHHSTQGAPAEDAAQKRGRIALLCAEFLAVAEPLALLKEAWLCNLLPVRFWELTATGTQLAHQLPLWNGAMTALAGQPAGLAALASPFAREGRALLTRVSLSLLTELQEAHHAVSAGAAVGTGRHDFPGRHGQRSAKSERDTGRVSGVRQAVAERIQRDCRAFVSRQHSDWRTRLATLPQAATGGNSETEWDAALWLALVSGLKDSRATFRAFLAQSGGLCSLQLQSVPESSCAPGASCPPEGVRVAVSGRGRHYCTEALSTAACRLARDALAAGEMALHEAAEALRSLLTSALEQHWQLPAEVFVLLEDFVTALDRVCETPRRPLSMIAASDLLDNFEGETSTWPWLAARCREVAVRLHSCSVTGSGSDTGNAMTLVPRQDRPGDASAAVPLVRLPVYLAQNIRELLTAPERLRATVEAQRLSRLSRCVMLELRMLATGAHALQVYRVGNLAGVLADVHQMLGGREPLAMTPDERDLLVAAHAALRRNLNQAAARQETSSPRAIIARLYLWLESACQSQEPATDRVEEQKASAPGQDGQQRQDQNFHDHSIQDHSIQGHSIQDQSIQDHALHDPPRHDDAIQDPRCAGRGMQVTPVMAARIPVNSTDQSSASRELAARGVDEFEVFYREAEQLMERIEASAAGCIGEAAPRHAIGATASAALLHDLHTLKGSAAMFNLESVSALCHQCESVLLAGSVELPGLIGLDGERSPSVHAPDSSSDTPMQLLERLRTAIDALQFPGKAVLGTGSRDWGASGNVQRDGNRDTSPLLPSCPGPANNPFDGQIQTTLDQQACKTGMGVLESTVPIPGDALQRMTSLARSVCCGFEALRDMLDSCRQQHDSARLTLLTELLSEQEQRAIQLAEEIAGSRLVSFARTTPRLQRLVGRHSNLLDKQIRFSVHNDELRADRLLLARLLAPLEHLLRNAIDHGVETIAERRAAGKPDASTISLRLQELGETVVIELQDDGVGIDPQSLATHARRCGLMVSGNETVAERLQWLFMPGFSSRAAATEASGHGLGLAAVQAAVLALGGRVEVESSPGHGSCFRLLVPRNAPCWDIAAKPV